MTSKEFVLWLKGFVEGEHDFNIIPKQWDYLKQKLSEVDDTTQSIGNPIGNGGWWGTTPYSIPCGTITTGGTITTSNYPSGSTFTYTTGNGGLSTYTMGGTITSTTSAYVNQSSEDDEKLLLD